MSKEGIITLVDDDGVKRPFFVEEQTKLNGHTYLLVVSADTTEDDVEEALILRLNTDGDEDLYDTIEDEDELSVVSKYFEQVIGDVTIV